MVVELTVPSTRTLWPFVTAFAVVELVPFSYFVEGFSSIVIFCPADVVIVKLDVDTLRTVPDAPPCAGAERALGALAPEALGALAPEALGATSCAAVAAGEVARLTGSPIVAHISAAAATRPLVYSLSIAALSAQNPS